MVTSSRPKVLFALKHVEFIDPMGIMLLSALAKERGWITDLCVLSDESVIEAVKKQKPDIVAFSAKTGEHKYYLAANREIKARYGKSIFTIMGGPHPTYARDVVEKENFDAICRGEGFDAWPEFLDAYSAGKSIDDVPNIVTKTNSSSDFSGRLRPRREHLDSLPFLDRDLVYRKTRLGRFPLRSIMASYGCPFQCTYCFNHVFNELYKKKGKIRNRLGVDRLIAELKDLKRRWPVQFVKFYDDVFSLKDDEWLEEFAEKYSREISLPFHCLVRCDGAANHPRMLELLKKAGAQSISMSIEAGSDYVRENILRRHMTRRDIRAAFENCRRLDIATFSNAILAIPVPDEVMKSEGKKPIDYDVETLDLHLECGATFGEFGSLFPYPGNELADYLVRGGLFNGNYDDLPMNYSNASPLSCFSEREKLAQHNLGFLGTICLLFPSLRNLVVKRLIYWPIPFAYYLAYYLVKVYLIWFKIYPMKFSLRDAASNFYYSFVLEKFKHLSRK